MKTNKLFKFIIGISVTAAIVAGGLVGFYIKGLPYIVSHPKTIKYAQKMTQKYTGANLVIRKPVLHTEFSPVIDFDVKQIYLEKDGKLICTTAVIYDDDILESLLSQGFHVRHEGGWLVQCRNHNHCI